MNDVYAFILEYLILRRAWCLGYMPFSNFKRIIEYALGIRDIYYIRKVFLHLRNKGFFIRRKNMRRSYLYKFLGPKEDKWPIVVEF
jgi:hypothetical protein